MRPLFRFAVLSGVILLAISPRAWCADKLSAPELIALAEAHSPDLRAGIESTFEAKQLRDGTAWVGRGPDFFFAMEASSAPSLIIDEAAGRAMKALPAAGSERLWYAVAHIEPVAKLHQFHYIMDGAPFGGSLDVPAFGPLSYLQPGVPSGKLSEKIVHTSKIYDGMKNDYWIYVPAEYDPQTPAALMVFQDGGGYIDRSGNNPALNVIDNLIAEKKIPVMICVFINPGYIAGSPGTPTYDFVKGYSEKWHRTLQDSMRSTLYDTVSDRYVRYLRDEILPEVAAKYNLRTDAYSHAITGGSSGGICSFNAAWQMPELFSRVISWIGSFTSIQWKEDPANPEGGQDYPEKVLREPKRNLRVWLEDGANDEEIDHFGFHSYGSWPLGNIQMANSLKGMRYDFHLSFGKGTHNSGGGAAEFPAEMMWLWRDYDAAKTEQEFTMDPAEKNKPYFRVAALNRATD
ncbi:MAG TPA: alpha/beta hydrolase-fold protein [Terracidiphilus sp.]|nr:alpha/beta hydrolase-fold protein [Terracidiphilus sp.]